MAATDSDDRPPRRDDESISEYIKRLEAIEAVRDCADTGNKSQQQSRRSSGDGAADSVIMPIRNSAPPSESGSQETTAAELLDRFRSRKVAQNGDTDNQQQSKRPAAETIRSGDKDAQKKRTTSDRESEEFLGFGHEAVSQAQKPEPPKSKQERNKVSKFAPTTAKSGKQVAKGDDRSRSSSAGDIKTSKALPAKPTKMSGESTNAHGKRPSLSEGLSFSKLPKIQKKTSVASPQSPDRGDGDTPDAGGINVSNEERPPKWYMEEPMPNTRGKNENNVSTLLQRLSTAIKKRSVDTVRDIIHELPFEAVNPSLLKVNRMLHNEHGLPRLFDQSDPAGEVWPYDIAADAQELYHKWCRKIFETDLLRGIILKSNSKKEGGDRNNDRIAPNYAGKVDFHAFGNNDLSNGQWFPTQLTTVRDGAHGATQGGISGKSGAGAWSVILTGHSGYPDEDNGDEVLYCGTDSDDATITDRTQQLIDSMKNEHPVRFIRKSTLKSEWAPEVGYRYDGLYAVKDFEKLNPDQPKLARHRFRLVRLPGQDPIRGTGAEKRPTEQEIARYKMDKRFR